LFYLLIFIVVSFKKVEIMKRLLMLAIAAALMPWTLRAATPSPFPQLSEGGTEHYYSIFSHRASRVLKNNGVDSIITSVRFDETNDTLKWKFVRVKANSDDSGLDTFKIVSKVNGNELFYQGYIYVGDGNGNYTKNPNTGAYAEVADGAGNYKKLDRFITRPAGEGSTFIFKKYKDDGGFIFQIWCVEESSHINMTNNTAPRYEICIYSVNDDAGNPFSAASSLSDFNVMYPNAPECSTSANPKWYQLQFARGSKAITSKGLGKRVKQETRIESGDSTTQMFRMEGDLVNGFKVVCMDNNMEMKFVNFGDTGRIALVAFGEGDLFRLVKTGVSTELWQLRHVDKSSFINETQSEACLYSYDDDAGNRIRFITEGYDPYVGAPLLSDASNPKWYYLKNSRTGRALHFRGMGQQVYTESLAEGGVKQDSQLFRFEGVYRTGFKIISKLNGELKYHTDTKRFFVEEAGDTTFMFEKSSNYTYGAGKWGIWYEGANGLNAHNTKKDEVTIYQLSDDGSVWDPIHVSRKLTISVNDAERGSVNKETGLYVNDSTIAIVVTPKPHFGLTSWTINGAETPATSDTLNLKMDKDVTLVANFKGNDTLLSTLTVTAREKDRLFPAFDPKVSAQRARVPHGVTEVTIAATLGHELSTFVGDTGKLTLTGDETAFTIAVTAENGVTKTYRITVERAQAGASSDVALSITSNLEPAVTTSNDTITVPIPSDSITVTIGGNVTTGATFVGSTGTFVLGPDKDSTLNFTVQAADCETTKAYTVILHHRSKNALLSALTVAAGSDGANVLSPSFAVDRVSYTATVSKSATSVNITATPQSRYAQVIGAGTQALSGSADTFRVSVTAEEGGQPTTYTIVITYLNNDATLRRLVLIGNANDTVALTPAFSPSVTQYAARTLSPTVTLTAAPTDANASAEPARRTYTLTGDSVLQVTVTAQDGVVRATYEINVTFGEPQATWVVKTLAEGSLTIYPNPVAGGVLTIENGELKSGERIAIYNIAGSLVAIYDASAGERTTINVSRLPKGAYIVKLGARAAKLVVN
jgi:hypothetical protein